MSTPTRKSIGVAVWVQATLRLIHRDNTAGQTMTSRDPVRRRGGMLHRAAVQLIECVRRPSAARRKPRDQGESHADQVAVRLRRQTTAAQNPALECCGAPAPTGTGCVHASWPLDSTTRTRTYPSSPLKVYAAAGSVCSASTRPSRPMNCTRYRLNAVERTLSETAVFVAS